MLSTRSFEFTLDFSFVLSACDLGENDTDDFLRSVASITSLRRRTIIKTINTYSQLMFTDKKSTTVSDKEN